MAVKVLKQEFSENANFVSKFRIEAQAAAGRMHPNIVNVCDVFDELICGIGYRRLKIYQAVEYLKGYKNLLFDGKVVDALLEFTAVYPTGSVILTNEKEVGIVLKQNKYFPERPVIQISRDKNGNTMEKGKIIDLVQVKNVFIDSVLE